MDPISTNQHSLSLPPMTSGVQTVQSMPTQAVASGQPQPLQIVAADAFQGTSQQGAVLPLTPGIQSDNAANPSLPTAMQNPVVQNQSQPTEMSEDALDQEWINKAKEIVEHTLDDPFAQSTALNEARVSYLHQRYGKDLKQP